MMTFVIWYNFLEDFGDETFGLLGSIFFCTLFSPVTIAVDLLFSPIEIISLIIFGIVKFIQWVKWKIED